MGDTLIMLAVSASVIGAGAMLIVAARRAATGEFAPTEIAGIRAPATRSSPEAWLAAAQASEQLKVVGGWMMVVAGVAAPLVALAFGPGGPAAVTWASVLLVGTLLATAAMTAAARRGQAAAVAVRDGDEDPTRRSTRL